METVLISLVVFALAVLGLSIGTVLKKRTPLKGSCGGVANMTSNGGGQDCESCSCSGTVQIQMGDER